MATYYVGIGGDDGANGTTWALRKLTLNGAENIPVTAGDTVYVGPGTYREMLTVDVSGSAGSPITYIGDYSGANTNGVGGVVRITGSDDDQSAARANCITTAGSQRNYRTWRGFVLDMCTNSDPLRNDAAGTNWIVDQCYFADCPDGRKCINLVGACNNSVISNCVFFAHGNAVAGIDLNNGSTVSDTGIVISNCLFLIGLMGINSTRVGGVTVKNSTFLSRGGINIATALAAGQTITVNNCLFAYGNKALTGTAAGEIIENYNTFWANATNRTNTDTGANSVTYPPLFDTCWFFELVSGKGRMLSPFDLASYSQLVNVAGTSPSSTDARGTGTVGTQREWGALEYDPALLYRRVIARQV